MLYLLHTFYICRLEKDFKPIIISSFLTISSYSRFGQLVLDVHVVSLALSMQHGWFVVSLKINHLYKYSANVKTSIVYCLVQALKTCTRTMHRTPLTLRPGTLMYHRRKSRKSTICTIRMTLSMLTLVLVVRLDYWPPIKVHFYVQFTHITSTKDQRPKRQ